MGLFDNETLVAFFEPQHFERDLLHFQLLWKLHNLVAVQLHFALFHVRVFFQNRQTWLQRNFVPDANDIPGTAFVVELHFDAIRRINDILFPSGSTPCQRLGDLVGPLGLEPRTKAL